MNRKPCWWRNLVCFVGMILLPMLLISSCGSDSNGSSNPSDEDWVETNDVIYIQDGAIDEFMASVLLTTMEEANLIGIIVVNADTIWNVAMDVQWKVLSLIEKTDIPVGLSNARGFNPFPWQYRDDCVKMESLEELAPYPSNNEWAENGFPSGDELLRSLLEDAYRLHRKVTVLLNCPATPLTDLLQQNLNLQLPIGRLIWMAGAINVEGNLVDPSVIPSVVTNPYAEWNVFWDPYAAEWLFSSTSIPIILFPLDVTNQVHLSTDNYLMKNLQSLTPQYAYATLAYSAYHLVSDEDFYDLWDTTSACWISRPDLFQAPAHLKLRVSTGAEEQGRLIPDDAGREIQAVLNLKEPNDPIPLYDYMLQQYSRN